MARIEQPLPASLWMVVNRTLADDDMPLADRFEAVVLIAHGYGLWLAQPGKIDPKHYAIPLAQWTTICQALIDARNRLGHPDDAGAVNLGLSWMNIGPSAYPGVAREHV